MRLSLILFFLFSWFGIIAQEPDTELKKLLETNSTPSKEAGLDLIQSGQYEQANKFFSDAITKDESDRSSYFNRGVSNWALSDTVSACRDWSSVLALGDTEMFNLLESKCHSTMIIEEDSIPAKQYRKIFTTDEDYRKNAKEVVDVMPEFPGGQEKLFHYIREKKQKIPEGKKGTVYVNFVVSPTGKVLFPYVTHGLGDPYDKAAIQLVRNMPLWIPGKLKGKPVYVKTNIPVRL